ncbi:DNA-binding protein [Streptomyces sp. 7-21]|jgi:predicted transcriptional regulator|uniref:helix-turn-helix domain-containing protein n=1 Tax=Streptomyces sp. 7-21 TaxID=2802283 RepID=UPI00191F5B3C|nr:DNA-binding protein [Streptomyces sp. 7-21]MBL1066108.1 DNA-binding protein [Streptomyces sp. 7-21]
MDVSQQEATQKAREQQTTWYGEPLGTLFRRLISDLGLNQARLAVVLGLSAPMLSQLMSGQRAKIGNPAVVQRVRALQELAAEVRAGRVSAAEATAAMEEIRRSAGGNVLGPHTSSTRSSSLSVPANPSKRVVREIQALLRSVSDATEIQSASRILADSHPELAEFLRVYGVARTREAIEHYETHQG